MPPRQLSRQEVINLKRSLANTIPVGSGQSKLLKKVFGKYCACGVTKDCPHLQKGKHVSGYCTCAVSELKTLIDKQGIRPLQIGEVFNSLAVLTQMNEKIADGEPVPKVYDKVQKNYIQLLDKIRRQDEGVKIGAHVIHTHDDIRALVKKSKEMIIDVEVVKQQKALVRGTSIFQSRDVEGESEQQRPVD